MKVDYKIQLREIVFKDDFTMELLRCVRSLGLPHWYIGAGAIRNLVWDHLHGYGMKTTLHDVDVAYYVCDNIDPRRDLEIWQKLSALKKDVCWNVMNQARAHLLEKNCYKVQCHSCEEAMATWVEVATCVGVRLEDDDSLTVCAPYGLGDLFELKLGKVPMVSEAFFLARVKQKGWLEKWPCLVFG